MVCLPGDDTVVTNSDRPALDIASFGGLWQQTGVSVSVFATSQRLEDLSRTERFIRNPVVAALGYGFGFALLARGFLPELSTSVPFFPNRNDEQLVVWILDWVAGALRAAPGGVFDAPINFPLGDQLTSSDHFFASQLIFLPVESVVANPLLAAGLTALATYPLAAWAMQRLLLAVGCHASTAWVLGLLFALGPRRVPFNLHVLQYANLFFPLAALCLVQLRRDPRAAPALGLFLVFLLGVLSSFYMALLLAIVALVWGAWTWLLPGPSRGPATRLAAVAAVGAVALSLAVLHPYFSRVAENPQALQVAPLELPSLWAAAAGNLPGASPYPLALLLPLAVAMAALGVVRGIGPVVHLAPPAVALGLLGVVLMPGIPEALGGVLERTPLRFFHYTVRFQLLVGFSGVLLLAAALESIGTRSGRRLRSALLLAALFAIAFGPARTFAGPKLLRVPALTDDASIYRTVGELAREHGSGSLLELPLRGRTPLLPGVVLLEPDSMLGATLHELPLITGYTGHQPPYRPLLLSTLRSLPLDGVLADLVGMTALRWILLRPSEAWESEADYQKMVSSLIVAPEVDRVWRLEGWLLLRLADGPQGVPGAISMARPGPPDTSIFGTPWRRLREGEAAGEIDIVAAPGGGVPAGGIAPISLRVQNSGSAAWPVAVRPIDVVRLHGYLPMQSLRRHAVVLTMAWIRLEADGSETIVREDRRALRRDIQPGETIFQQSWMTPPKEPGRYLLEIGLRQIEGPTLDPGGDGPARLMVDVGRSADASRPADPS